MSAKRSNTAPAAPLPAGSVDLIVYPDAMVGTALLLIDLLRVANRLALLQSEAAPVIRWRLLDGQAESLALILPGTSPLWAPYLAARGSKPVTRGADGRRGDGAAAARRACFIAPMHVRNIPQMRQAAAKLTRLVGHVAEAAARGDLIATMDNGCWLVARSGALDAHRLTLPWYYLQAFRVDFPTLQAAPDERCLRDGLLLTATGHDALVDLAVGLVRHLQGAPLAQTLDHVIRHDPARQRSAAELVAGQHVHATRDSTLALAIEWMHANLAQPYRLAAVAQAASVSPRTLTRHFRSVLGRSPLDHLHQLRCERAKILLELTLQSVPTVATACGYDDPTAFRRIFARYQGQTPALYRAQHAVRSSRKRWKVEDASLL
jgi:transcriptional regulator GlxA family with amidase domain